MKNVEKHQLRTCIFMTEKEFDSVIKTIYGDKYDAHFSFYETEHSSAGITVYSVEGGKIEGISRYRYEKDLSKYFDIGEILFIQIAPNGYRRIGVWIGYNEKIKHRRNSYG